MKTLGWEAIAWIEAYLVHGPGDVQGQPITLDDEQADFILRAYEVDEVTGRRLVRRAVFSRPKGRAKSELAGMLACFEALGPARFDGWGADGQPVGRPVRYPEILCVATEETQAGNTYDNVAYMMAEGAVFDAYPGIDVGRRAATSTRVLIPGGGTIEPVSSGAASKDGGKSSFVIFDETHLHVKPELLRLNAFIRRNLGKRKAAEPWAFDTTTMYAPGEGSIAEATHQMWVEITEGRRRNQGLLFDHREAPHVEDLHDTAAVLAALRHVYGPAAEWMDLERVVAEIQDPMSNPADSRRYWFNQATPHEVNAWMPSSTWDAAADPRPIPAGADVVLALDGSFNDDSTALVAIELSDPPHVAVAGAWERPMDAPRDWRVDILDVEETIRGRCREWRVLELIADPYRWERSLQVIADETGVPVHAFPQTANRMTPATNRFKDSAVNGGLTHDGDPRLARHVTNAVLHSDSRGTRLAKERGASHRKIDLAVAAVMGFERAEWHRANALTEPSVHFI